MKYFRPIRSLIFPVLIFVSTAALAQEKPIAVYLLIGQSNMAGRAELSEADLEPISGAVLFNARNQWEPAMNPLNRHSTIRKEIRMQRMGPGYGFATAMAYLVPEETVGLVVNAKGGSAIEEWLPGTPFFADAVARTKAALETSGAEWKGILWHQGEANAASTDYREKLQALVSALRAELGDVPFVAGELFAPTDQPARAEFNRNLTDIVAAIPHSSHASSRTLTGFDEAHFDSASMRLLGLRYAERMATLHREIDAEAAEK